MVTPTALLAALYAEYDGLLDSLESVQLQLKSKDISNERTRGELQNKEHNICEALADAHEKIADFDSVVMRRQRRSDERLQRIRLTIGRRRRPFPLSIFYSIF